MNYEIFEVIMLICFGAAWPFSIYKIIKSRQSSGKSIPFGIVIFIGYISGICFHVFGHKSYVIYFYALNALMVLIDLFLTVRYASSAEEVRGAGTA